MKKMMNKKPMSKPVMKGTAKKAMGKNGSCKK